MNRLEDVGERVPLSERTGLLSTCSPHGQTDARDGYSHPTRSYRFLAVVALALAALLYGSSPLIASKSHGESSLRQSGFKLGDSGFPIEGKGKYKKDENFGTWEPPQATQRCDWVVHIFRERNVGLSEEELKETYAVQSTNANVFFRATAQIFWMDFDRIWGNVSFADIGVKAKLADGSPLQPKSTWTWVTGDQHLSNFGAWRNRHGDLVFSVNDFDEAAIYDFHVDVDRIAVSVCNHAFSNGLSEKQVKKALKTFTDTYIDTCIGYVDNEKALLYELTPRTSTGFLKNWLTLLDEDKSAHKQLEKFTGIDEAGNRYFVKTSETKLDPVSPEVFDKIRFAFTYQNYRATMQKVGWHVRSWDPEYFKVIDVAARIGTGVGSYGVDRYYVLLNGEDKLLGKHGDGNAVILDVKYEPKGAVWSVLSEDDRAWYKVLFRNDAARAVTAQRRLTSYVDPFTGWVVIDDEAFVVRQRSPWKAAPDLDALTDPLDFNDFMRQVAVATATSHVRGTAAQPPAEFKQVIASVLGKKSNRRVWGNAMYKFARSYHEQVKLDFQCFKEFVDANYPSESDGDGSRN